MELTELCSVFKELLKIENVIEAPQKLLQVLFSCKNDFFDEWISNFPDLSTDNLQPIFQYYMADRKEKMQDYTPKTLARMCVKIAGVENAKSCYDMCAGSGALTIQAWQLNSKCQFVCEEFDERVIPFLLCNLAMRNMSAVVIHGDVIKGEKMKAYKLTPTEKYSNIEEVKPPRSIHTDVCISNPPYNIKWTPEPFIALDERYVNFGAPPSSNANYAFVLTALNTAKSSCLILPCGVLSPSTAAEIGIVEQIVKANKLNAVVINPGEMFEATSIGTCLFHIRNDKTDTMTAFVDMRNTYTEETRAQKGQFGGASHTNRIYTKSVKTFSDEQIEKALTAVKQRTAQAEFSKSASIEDIKSSGYKLAPSIFIEFVYKMPSHRSYGDILSDINRVRNEQNCCKLVINETLAKRFGFDTELYSREQNDKNFNDLLFKLTGEKLKKTDYVQFTKNKNEFTFKNNSSDAVSSILVSIMSIWKQHIMYLNNEENRYLAEMRDALLPDLMSGNISI